MQGNFFWYDLMTTDAAAARKFYSAVVGWGTKDDPGTGYVLFTVDGAGALGLMTMPKEMRDAGAPSCWTGYVHVEDVDAALARIEKLGGKRLREPTLVPDVIRYCPVADPQGAVFMIAKPMPTGEPPKLAPNHVGMVGWRELYATDGTRALGFYAEAFGWTKGATIDMGAFGAYQLFKTPESSDDAGGMMTKPPHAPGPCWMFYFNVESIDAASKRVTEHGGKVVHGPVEVPGGSWIIQCVDPQGARFALSAAKK